MSRRTDRKALRSSDSGFTLIEVIVCLGLLAVVTVAVLGVTVAGLRAAGASKFASQAKGLSQARLELMRALPFHVDRSAGDHIDVLDEYYPRLVVPTVAPACNTGNTLSDPLVTWVGFVPASSSARCSYEPKGPLYRKVVNPIQAPGIGVFAAVIDTQFLDSSTPPVPISPTVGYDNSVPTADSPPAQQVGVTVTILYRVGAYRKAQSSYTQIAQRTPSTPTIDVRANVEAVRISSAVDPGQLLFNMGIVNQRGALFTGSRVQSEAIALAGSLSTGESVTGAQVTSSAPLDTSGVSNTAGTFTMSGGCVWVCAGPSSVVNAGAVADSGLPRSGSPALPVTTTVANTSIFSGFGFDNDSNDAFLDLIGVLPLATFDSGNAILTGPPPEPAVPTLAWNTCQSSTAGGGDALMKATGYLDSTLTGNTHTVSSCATAQAQTIALFRTNFAPHGVIRVRLNSASTGCLVSVIGTTPTATSFAKYDAQVWYFNGLQYVLAATVNPSNTTDPLAGVPLTTSVGGGHTLGQYISSWATLTSPSSSGGALNTATAAVGGVVTIDSQPMRRGSTNSGNGLGGAGTGTQIPSSVFSTQIGSLSCTATDRR